MKKLIFVIILIVSVMAFTIAYASNNQDENAYYNSVYDESKKPLLRTFNLPISVEIIEDEAFEGTAITNIVLPETVTIIGDRAFANIKTLRTIRIPMSTASIAKTAFIGTNNVTITAAPNSYARTWAKENGLPFSPLTVIYAGTGNQSITASLSSVSKEVPDTESSETQDTYRTWRKIEEIQVHDTIEIIANVIQGRAPPMS